MPEEMRQLSRSVSCLRLSCDGRLWDPRGSFVDAKLGFSRERVRGVSDPNGLSGSA